MFGHRYFGARHFGPRYFGDGGEGAPPLQEVVLDGGRWPIPRGKVRVRKPRHVPAKLKDQHPEDIERERRMVQQYLDDLEAVKETPRPAQDEPAIEPRLTEAMARAAKATDLKVIATHESAAEADRAVAEEERRRRRRAATAAVLLMSH